MTLFDSDANKMTPNDHSAVGDIPLYQVMEGLGTPVTLQASFTVCPSSAVQFARISSKSGGPAGIKHENSSH